MQFTQARIIAKGRWHVSAVAKIVTPQKSGCLDGPSSGHLSSVNADQWTPRYSVINPRPAAVRPRKAPPIRREKSTGVVPRWHCCGTVSHPLLWHGLLIPVVAHQDSPIDLSSERGPVGRLAHNVTGPQRVCECERVVSSLFALRTYAKCMEQTATMIDAPVLSLSRGATGRGQMVMNRDLAASLGGV
jgi:hypothetical protein